jgi:hypothetical protein
MDPVSVAFVLIAAYTLMAAAAKEASKDEDEKKDC